MSLDGRQACRECDDIRINWPIVINYNLLDELICGSLSTNSRRFNVSEDWYPWERGGTYSTRDETRGRVQLYINQPSVRRPQPNWGTILCHRVAESQGRCLEALGIGTPASFISRLFLFFSFPAVFVRCSLKDSVQSSVTPR